MTSGDKAAVAHVISMMAIYKEAYLRGVKVRENHHGIVEMILSTNGQVYFHIDGHQGDTFDEALANALENEDPRFRDLKSLADSLGYTVTKK